MATPTSIPLKAPGQRWPGTNTRGGRLDDGSGQLQLIGSKNVIINEGDTLAKRPGFVRGLDERFVGTVCGLHKYTDECGIEHLLVVDEEGFKIRQPFAVPVFQVSDRFPNDGFVGTADRVNLDRWVDEALAYELVDGSLRLRNGLTNSDQAIRWFKETPLAIRNEVQIAFEDEDTSTTSVVVDLLSSQTDFSEAGLRFTITREAGADSYSFVYIDSAGNQLSVATGGVAATALTIVVRFNPTSRILELIITPTGEDTIFADRQLTEAQVADLGGWYGLKIETDTVGNTTGVLQVSSDAI